MTIHESQSESVPFPVGRSSHRTRPEQLVGLGIYLLLSFGFEIVSGLTTQFLATFYALFLALGMWALWRKFSLRVLKLELSVFLAQFLLQIGWSVSQFVLKQSLLGLVALLLLTCNTLLAALLFWKKERISGLLYGFPLIWVFYLAFSNMIACISNPKGH